MKILLFLYNINFLNAYINSFFNYWHCIGIQEKIDFNKPYLFNVCDLDLVLYKNQNTYFTTMKFISPDIIGQTILHEGKIFWSYKPFKDKPDYIPNYNHQNYKKTFLEITMPCSLENSTFNIIDLLYPEYINNDLFGFNNNIPLDDLNIYNNNNYIYNNEINNYIPSVALSFNYFFKNFIIRNFIKTKIFYLFIYPSFSWSCISFQKKKIYIGINLLPISNKETKWFITICHNFSEKKLLLKIIIMTILRQNYYNIKKKSEKKNYLLNNYYKDIIFYNNYKYADINDCIELYKDYILTN